MFKKLVSTRVCSSSLHRVPSRNIIVKPPKQAAPSAPVLKQEQNKGNFSPFGSTFSSGWATKLGITSERIATVGSGLLLYLCGLVKKNGDYE